MSDTQQPRPCVPDASGTARREKLVEDFRREVQDKLGVVFHGAKNPLLVQRQIALKQCEDFLVEQFESVLTLCQQGREEGTKTQMVTCFNCNTSFPVVVEQTALEARLTASEHAREGLGQGWMEIASLPDDIKRDGTVILRPHVIYGAMDVRWKPGMYGGDAFGAGAKHYNWINGDYTTSWPDEALAPFWMPIPAYPPLSEREGVREP